MAKAKQLMLSELLKALKELKDLSQETDLPVYLTLNEAPCKLSHIELNSQADVNFKQGDLTAAPEWVNEITLNLEFE